MTLQAPPAAAIWSETTALFELPRLLLRMPALRALDSGVAGPVMVLPGYGASDASTLPLRLLLAAVGFKASGWGIGRNGGDVEQLLPRVAAAVAALAVRHGSPVQLLGWSLGGVLAREVARDAPAHVRQVITLGTPVVGGPKYTLVGRRYAAQGYDLDAIEREVEARHRVPIRAPVTAIYSRTDGVVAWQACIDPWTPDVEHIEVGSSHMGLGLDPDVYRLVVQRMAAPRQVLA
jgi:pimeloyl-ACP methyl ester carboxylesterase